MRRKKGFDYSRKRATDIKQNTKIHLPKAVKVEEEASLEMLRMEWRQVFKESTKENCDKKGNPKSNLTQQERRGMKSLKKRLKDGEIVVLPTDKSGRFCVTLKRMKKLN